MGKAIKYNKLKVLNKASVPGTPQDKIRTYLKNAAVSSLCCTAEMAEILKSNKVSETCVKVKSSKEANIMQGVKCITIYIP